MFWSIIGMAAAVLSMFSFLPQIAKIYRTKSAHDVSLATIIQLSSGVVLWALYGIHLRDTIIIMANIITLITMVILLYLYFKYGKVRAKEGQK